MTKEEAFELNVKKFQKLLFKTAIAIVKCPGIADDIVQEAFIKFHEKFEHIEESKIKNWLTLIVYNLSKSKASSIQKHLELNSYFLEGEDLQDYQHWIEQAIEREEIKDVSLKIKYLPRVQRKILAMSLDGRSLKDIALDLNSNYETVRSSFYIGCQKIRNEISC